MSALQIEPSELATKGNPTKLMARDATCTPMQEVVQRCQEIFRSAYPNRDPPLPQFFAVTFRRKTISAAIDGLDTSKAAGPDGQHSLITQAASTELCGHHFWAATKMKLRKCGPSSSIICVRRITQQMGASPHVRSLEVTTWLRKHSTECFSPYCTVPGSI